jgi:hypothetical protein
MMGLLVTRPRGWITIATVALVLLLPVALALPQDTEETLDEEALPQGRVVGQAGYAYQGKADIEGGGDLRVHRFDVGLLGRADLLERLRWTNTFFFSVNDYDFGGGGFSTGDPWETILTMRLVTKLRYQLSEQWGVFAGGVFISAAETDADWGDSFSGGGLVGVDFRHSKSLSVSLGVAMITQLADDARLTPMVSLNWLPHEHWAVRVGAAAAGEVTYRVTKPVELGLGLLYKQRRFRLDDSGVAPDGVGEDNNLPLRLHLGWDITPQISLHFLGGAALGGEVRLDDRNGNRINKQDYDPAPYVGLRFVGGF